MSTAWDEEALTVARYMPAQIEARLISNLAQFRANQASNHPEACTCDPCRVRRIDNNRRSTARLVVLHGGRS